VPEKELLAHFSGERHDFVKGIFDAAKFGKTWYTLNPADVARALGSDRGRVVRAVEYFGEQGWAEVQASDARLRFTRVAPHADAAALAAELVERFGRRERQEIERVRAVVELASRDGCITNGLLAHFGEAREAPCGHCTFCERGTPAVFPAPPAPPPISSVMDAAAFRAVRDANPEALGAPRQQARFLCGLTSPALTRARLGRNPLFGALEERRFSEVLAWCEGVG
jgi:ATP-dependent DNA helicase RecQ